MNVIAQNLLMIPLSYEITVDCKMLTVVKSSFRIVRGGRKNGGRKEKMERKID